MAVPSPQDDPGSGVRAVFARLLGLFALLLYPILHADRPYNDDLKRALLGRASWDSNGRPLTTLLMRALQCYDHAMVDIAPLPQIGAIVLLAWTGARLARRFTDASPWLAALLVFPLGAQPFFLENLSYQFDALSMALAIWLAVWPLLLPTTRRGSGWGIASLFGALCLYQPAINVFLVLTLAELVLTQATDHEAAAGLRTLLRRTVQIAVAMVVYELLVGMHISGWVKRQATPIHGWREIPRIADNVTAFYGFVGSSFNANWWAVFGTLATLLALACVVVGVRHARSRDPHRSRSQQALLVGLAVTVPGLAMVAALGPMLLLRAPEIQPRVLIGIGALLAAGLLLLRAALRTRAWGDRACTAVAAAFALGMGVIASAYGNAMTDQQHFEQHVAAQLADDLAAWPAATPIRRLAVTGSTGFSPLAEHVISEFPLMRALVPTYLDATHRFATSGWLMFYLPQWVDARRPLLNQPGDDDAALAARCANAPDRVAVGYRLCVQGDTALVQFQPPALPTADERR
ncbi:glucosyltransferase domain-containing protein [Dyella ginsengisoli]|uniref:Glucosyltransferase domain-containing protein n=1 Tax=Dyella ginsengisoli TaxID=363848 RepID=A0ABW8JYT4_9GAMM